MADHLRAGGPPGHIVDIPPETVGRKFIENLGVLSALGLGDSRQRDCGSCVCSCCGTTPAQRRQRVVEGAQAEGITGYFQGGAKRDVNADHASALTTGKEVKRKCGRGGEIATYRQDGRLYEAEVCGIPPAGRTPCANLRPARRLIHINAQSSCRWGTSLHVVDFHSDYNCAHAATRIKQHLAEFQRQSCEVLRQPAALSSQLTKHPCLFTNAHATGGPPTPYPNRGARSGSSGRPIRACRRRR